MSAAPESQRMEKIVSLCKRRGFIFQSSEIYGGLNGLWDYGPLGVELKRNLKNYWWRMMVHERDDVVGMDGAILMNRSVWKASGHEDTFTDPMIDCRSCRARLRGDQLVEKKGVKQCPVCGGKDLTEPRAFNLMFKTYVGATEDESSLTYLRPETAQAIFVQFKNILEIARKKLPFGIAQIGKAFRNEINPRNFTFRSREFEQMELEYFCRAEEGMKLLEYWKEERLKFYENIGIPRTRLHVLTVPDDERAFYSKGTYDIEYDFPFGRQELEGVAYRTDYDLVQHQKASGKPLEYFDEETKQKFIPHVVEPSAGVDRTVLALICEAYSEDRAPDEKGKMEARIVLRFHPRIAPIKCGVFPLLKNNNQLVSKAKSIVDFLRPHMFIFYDESGAIGRRYRRQDEIGTPFGITVDFETLSEKDAKLRNTVTLRERDSMKQERVPIEDLPGLLLSRIS
ncbi:MAG TPA: glycine--tRNA ligase [Chthoniobacterales bacterium]|jgi:glycyl-tRNA synthetase|nr:glycine--tRNA ligase [Chthoniobacterales bacterium]